MDTIEQRIGTVSDKVREATPLVHNITNSVTINECANALLGCGGSPIMSDEPEDVFDITTICSALVINIGTLNIRSIEAMFIAGRRAGELDHPIILDPVGAGASALRTDTASKILDELAVSVVRGNMSEIKALAEGATSTRGVDACPDDAVTPENLEESAAFARAFAQKTGAIVAITGVIDIVSSATESYAIFNGSAMQSKMTGAGCMLSSICGAYAVAGRDDLLTAITAAVASTGVCGEIAERRMSPICGNGSFREYLLDALTTLRGEELSTRARIKKVN